MKKNIVFGFIGVELDNMGKSQSRWKKWRPTVSLFKSPDIKIDSMVLLYTDKKFKSLVDMTIKDIWQISPDSKLTSHLIALKDPWDLERVYSALYEYFSGYQFKPNKEDYYIHISTGTHVIQISFYLLIEARYIPGKILQVVKPSPDAKKLTHEIKLIDLDLSRYDQIASRFKKQHDDEKDFLKYGIKTRNKKFNNIIEELISIALKTDDPILLLGPTGSGKTKLARQVYNLKRKKNLIKGKFKELNCGALPRELSYSILFGHEKGAYTGADKKREGLLADANNGILFLDEIGELFPELQAMLLKAVEEKSFLPLGSNNEAVSNFQLISGSNKDLYREARQGKFRDDLLARIDFWTYSLPSLVERKEDIEPNIDFELAEFGRRKNSLVSFNREARKLFLDFALSDEAIWSHNFRDLNASVSRMASLAPGGRIDVKIVEQEIKRLNNIWHKQNGGIFQSLNIINKYLSGSEISNIDLFDKYQLEGVLKTCKARSNLADAGRKLFSASRNKRKRQNDSDRLRKYLGKFGLKWDDL